MLDITALPPELLLEIFSYVPTEELINNVQHVCITWRQLVHNLSVWEHFVYFLETTPYFEETIRFIENCPMLKHINIYINDCTDNISEIFVSTVIKNCSDVRSFCVEFSDDVLTLSHINALFEAFPNLDCFKFVINSQNAVEIVDRISKCSKLKKLAVNSFEDCGSWLKPIVDGCVSLEHLEFSCPALPENRALYILDNMKDRLKYLRLPYPQPCTQTLVTALSSFSKLQDVRLHHQVECGRVNFKPLSSIKTLKCLEFISDTLMIDDVETIFDTLFCQPFPVLTKLTMNIYCSDWERGVLKEICRCYPNLQYLHLSFMHLSTITDSFENISRMNCLETLKYHHSNSITDDDVEYIAQCHKLKHLSLQGCSQLTDRAVVHIANCKSLEYVNLNYTSLTGNTLYLLNERLTKLKSLNVFSIKAEPEFVRLVVEKMPLVQVHYG